jgi:dTDP-4-amino-4,6-dideoxygalactose transaminase
VTEIPLVDLKAQHQQVAAEVAAGFSRVLENTSFILGKDVESFENQFAEYMAVKHCLGVGNGTDALELILRGIGVGAGDEVIVPTNSFIASALAVSRTGARPVLVDCDPVYYLIDPADIARKLTKKTKAIMPVHLFGQMAAMGPITKLAAEAGVPVVEDAAQAQGSKQGGRSPGAFGVAAGTSFYPGKNLGAYGDGGAVLTNSDEVAAKVRALRNYGSEIKYHHPELGFNSRLDSLQAVVLSAKLSRLDAWNEARRRAAVRYGDLLAGIPGVTLPRVLEGNQSIVHLYVVQVPRRDQVLKQLHAAKIGAGIHYPLPIHLQEALKGLGYKRGDLPVAERLSGEILSLPLYAEITEEQQTRVATELRKAVENAA